MMDKYIVSNQIRCLKCGDEPWSQHRHDFRYCKCEAVAVDGGQDYMRRLGTEYIEMSIVLPQDVVDLAARYAGESIETRRNGLGVALAVMRAIRDAGFEITEQEIDDATD